MWCDRVWGLWRVSEPLGSELTQTGQYCWSHTVCLVGVEQSLGFSFKWRRTESCCSDKCHQSSFLPVLQVDVLVNKTNLSLHGPNSVLPFYPSVLF